MIYIKQKNSLLYGLLGGLIGGIIVWFITSQVVNTNSTGMMRMMGIRTQNGYINTQSSDALDKHFIEQMIPHHEDAITMAKMAQSNAKKNEIKQLAKNILFSQSKEIDEMKQWYKEWFGIEVPKGTQVMNMHGMMGNNMHMGIMGNSTDITRLEQSENFDKTFIENMIPHHQMAVMMANMLLRSTNRSEMKQLAKNIIDAQTKEIDEMRQWYKDWGYTQ